MTADLFAAAQGLGYGSMIYKTSNDIYGGILSLDLWVDAKCLWDCITGIKTTTQKGLLIDLATMRDAYELKELTNGNWFSSRGNPANALKKRVFTQSLQPIMKEKYLDLNPNAWVERKKQSVLWPEKLIVAEVC